MKQKVCQILLTDFLLSIFFIFYKSLSQLVGAGGRLEATTYPLKARDCLVDTHADKQARHSLSVSCATACKFYSGYDSTLYVNVYLARANVLGGIGYMFHLVKRPFGLRVWFLRIFPRQIPRQNLFPQAFPCSCSFS